MLTFPADRIYGVGGSELMPGHHIQLKIFCNVHKYSRGSGNGGSSCSQCTYHKYSGHDLYPRSRCMLTRGELSQIKNVISVLGTNTKLVVVATVKQHTHTLVHTDRWVYQYTRIFTSRIFEQQQVSCLYLCPVTHVRYHMGDTLTNISVQLRTYI